VQYPGPDPFAPPPLPPEPSPAARTLGALGVVFGAIVVCADLLEILNGVMSLRVARAFSVSPGAVPTTPEAFAMQRAMEQYVRAEIPHRLLEGSLMMLMSMALMGIGIGLYRQRERARRLAVVWAIVGLAVLVVRACVWELWMWPRVNAFMRAITGGFLSSSTPGISGIGKYVGFMQGFAHGGEYVNLAFLAVFPVVLLAMLRLPQVRERMQ
jgi:hypothetical protein